MSKLKKFFGWRHYSPSLIDENSRKYQLIHTITFGLFLFGIVFTYINIYLQFWFVTYLLLVGTVITMVNLVLLSKKYNLLLCGHIINFLCIVIITLGNFCLGGISTSYMGWFYVSPIIAAATIGLKGLIIYGLIAALIIIIFLCNSFSPLYSVPEHLLVFINTINYISISLLIFITLLNLLKANREFETLLKEQNYLLQSDKKKFHYLSQHDPLTNLPNRAYFNNYLQTLIESTNTSKNTITLYFMDLDGFKKINDVYGHETGDLILLQATKRLQSCFRESDFIARLGGDEFTALIIHRTKDKIADLLVARINKEFNEPFLINNIEIKCTISIGKANYPSDTKNSETLLKLADDAMYQNKKFKYEKNILNHD